MAESTFDDLPDELQTRVARMLLRDDPLDAARLLSSSRALRQLAHGDGVAAGELRAARALATQLRLIELRVIAGLEKWCNVPVLRRLLPHLDAPPNLAWAPPEPVTSLDFNDYRWRVADGEARCRAVLGAVARVLRVSSSLVKLDLFNKKIGDVGAKALAAGVATGSSLNDLQLEYCGIGNEGAKALATSVAASASLVTLYLSNNQIGDEGAEAFAEAIRARSSLRLRHLNLVGNNISDAAKESLRDAVQGHISVRFELRFDPPMVGWEFYH